jgi:hypothetical protein
LLGSQAVAQDYKARGVNVIAMSQVGPMLLGCPCVHPQSIV